MFSPRRLAWIAFAGMVLAGCGGGGTSAVPPASRPPSSAVRNPQASSPAPGTLYVADNWHVYAYDLAATDPATVQRTVVPHPSQINTETIQGIATGSDGTLAILQNYFVGNDEHCRTVIEAAYAVTGTYALANYPCDSTVLTQGESIARSPSGFDVVFRNQYNGVFNSSYAVEHIGAGGAITGALQLPMGTWGSVATNAVGNDFVGSLGGDVLKYRLNETDNTAPIIHITVPGAVHVLALATAPDHTLYVAAGMFLGGGLVNQSIYAYAPGATVPSRTIGPFTQNYITAMAVDAQGLLYVATNGASGGHNRLRVFAANASGLDPSLRMITNPIPSYYEIKGLAIYQP